MDINPTSRMLTHFARKTLRDHLRAGFRQFWMGFVLVVCGVFGGYWGIAEGIAYFLKMDLTGGVFFGLGALAAIASGSFVTIRRYLATSPEGFEHESQAARRIALIQKPKWEFRLARYVLDEKLTALDDRLAGLLGGRTLVPIERSIPINEYTGWAMARFGTLRRMLNVATQLLVYDFPEAVRSTPDRPADPQAILSVVARLQDLYSEAVEFERSHFAVEPHEILQTAHALLRGWTEPIRNGVHQLERFLDELIALDPKGNHHVSFEITIDAPPTVNEFSSELDRIVRDWERGMR